MNFSDRVCPALVPPPEKMPIEWDVREKERVLRMRKTMSNESQVTDFIFELFY
jgi:hypothetical protein